MKLDIPYFKQEQSLSCGLAALRMVFGYYHDKASEKEMAKAIRMHRFGTFGTDLGGLAITRGYSAVCRTIYLPLLAPLKLPFGTEITGRHLDEMTVRPHDRMTYDSWQHYLKAGGKLIFDNPTHQQLVDVIEAKKPPIICVNLAIIGQFWKKWNNGHYLVVNGINKDRVHYLDPDLPEKLNGSSLPDEILMSAWIVNAIRSSAYLLTIGKPN